MTLFIPEEDFYRLPKRAQEMLRVYGGPVVPVDRGMLRFEVDEARGQEILEASRVGVEGWPAC